MSAAASGPADNITPHTSQRPCPVCKGDPDMQRGAGTRCFGFLTEDGWAHCTREDHAGNARHHPKSGTWGHRAMGPCPCGVEHAPDPEREARKPVATYVYTGEAHDVLFRVVRTRDKDFFQNAADGNGGWKTGRGCMKGVRRVPYKLPNVLEADPSLPVLLAEGEKDSENLWAKGFVASCNPGGAGKWQNEYSKHFAGRHVVILPDNDKVGRDHGIQVARSVAPHAASVKILELPGLPDHGDVSDWFGAGGTAEELRALIDRTEEWDATLDHEAAPEAGTGPDDSGEERACPPPEPTPADWRPLRLGMLPPVPPFPLDVFPFEVARMVADVARALGIDPGVPGGMVLAVAGGLNGRATSLLIEQNRFASSVVFHATVMLPGGGKSPCQRVLTTPVMEIDQVLADEFARDKAAYLDLCRREPKEKHDAPVPRRVVAENFTMESGSRVLAANPRGLLAVYDELGSLFTSLNQYKGGKGSDRNNLMKMWACAPIIIDRVMNEFGEPIRIPHPCLSIMGNIPPAMLGEVVHRRGDDGMIDRWLYTFPDRIAKLKSHERRPANAELTKEWSAIANRLWARRMADDNGRACPHVIYFTNPAKAEFNHGYDSHVDELNAPEFPDWLHGPWAKLEDYAGRFCLILTLLKHAADPTSDPECLPMAGVEEAHNAWRLVSYYKAHHLRVRAALQGKGLGGAPDGARLILKWLKGHPDREHFSESDLTQAYPPSRYDRAMIEDGLLWLHERNAIRPAAVPDRPKGRPGRKPAPLWDVHPELHGAQEKQEFQGYCPANAPENPDSPGNPDCPALQGENNRDDDYARQEREAIQSEEPLDH